MNNSIHIIGSKIGGGAERFYARLANSLSMDSQVLAVNPENSPVSSLLSQDVRQNHLPMKNNYDLASMIKIKLLAKEMAPCIVQSYMGRATRLTHISPKSENIHIARLGGFYNLKAYRHVHHLVGNTKGICDYLLKQGVPSSQVHYIGNFVEPITSPNSDDLKKLRQSLHIPDDALVITCAARFHENKGLPDLLEAFALLLKQNLPRPLRLILVGDGPMANEIKHQIQTLNIESEVILPGWCDPAPYYHLGDILTCPSRHEPLGNVILEAWACKKPLITTKTQGASELAAHGQDAWLTPVQNPQALADGFYHLINNQDLCIVMANAGHQKVTTHFSQEVITNSYRNLYENLLSKK